MKNSAFLKRQAEQMFAYALWKEEQGEEFEGALRQAAADEYQASVCIDHANTL
jgi:hypothetical protein